MVKVKAARDFLGGFNKDEIDMTKTQFMNQFREKEGSTPAAKTGYQFMYWTMFIRVC